MVFARNIYTMWWRLVRFAVRRRSIILCAFVDSIFFVRAYLFGTNNVHIVTESHAHRINLQMLDCSAVMCRIELCLCVCVCGCARTHKCEFYAGARILQNTLTHIRFEWNLERMQMCWGISQKSYNRKRRSTIVVFIFNRMNRWTHSLRCACKCVCVCVRCSGGRNPCCIKMQRSRIRTDTHSLPARRKASEPFQIYVDISDFNFNQINRFLSLQRRFLDYLRWLHWSDIMNRIWTGVAVGHTNLRSIFCILMIKRWLIVLFRIELLEAQRNNNCSRINAMRRRSRWTCDGDSSVISAPLSLSCNYVQSSCARIIVIVSLFLSTSSARPDKFCNVGKST